MQVLQGSAEGHGYSGGFQHADALAWINAVIADHDEGWNRRCHKCRAKVAAKDLHSHQNGGDGGIRSGGSHHPSARPPSSTARLA